MTVVEIMLRIIFCPVPDFIREEPVMNSGPTIISMGYAQASLIGAPGLEVMHPVRQPWARASLKAPTT